jgi:glutathione synthase/RimK-type ligase-like ATP-grasp enzyme
MRIAIHNSNFGFHPHWVSYCREQNIDFKLVDCYSNSIISDLKDCTALMWHHHHTNSKDILLAKQLLFSLEGSGIKLFPDFHSNWHFDDKVGQKYLLERIGAPLPDTHIFFDKESAQRFIKSCSYPIVHKLRHGAGSQNVQLVKTYKDAKRIVDKAFGKGISNYNKIGNLKERYKRWKSGNSDSMDLAKGIGRLFISPHFTRVLGSERGYVYFQDFIPNLDRDYRIKVVGNRIWGLQRFVREGDFRASGNTEVNHNFDSYKIPQELIRMALDLSKKLRMENIAFDFVIDNSKCIYLIEISALWGFDHEEFRFGYWDETYNFISGPFNPFGWMVDMMQ